MKKAILGSMLLIVGLLLFSGYKARAMQGDTYYPAIRADQPGDADEQAREHSWERRHNNTDPTCRPEVEGVATDWPRAQYALLIHETTQGYDGYNACTRSGCRLCCPYCSHGLRGHYWCNYGGNACPAC
jgi:hypothetical protein